MTVRSSRFQAALTQELAASLTNSYGEDNWDPERFGPYQPVAPGFAPLDVDEVLSPIANSLDALADVYELLGDEASQSLFVRVLAYRLLGPSKVKVPLNTGDYWSRRRRLRSLIEGTEAIDIDFLDMKLDRMSLTEIGYPIEMYFSALGAMNTFVLKQYQYSKREPAIKARTGDYVIDGGGCYGDTALYFANEVGEQGKVFSFEFAPANLVVHRRNVQLNPNLRERIETVSRALWHTSGKVFHYRPFGPATQVTDGRTERFDDALAVTTVSLDDFVGERALPRVDFVKMDIEGAEPKALEGAERTLRRFVPSLAISVYHRDSDFADIPRFLNGLELGYRFFLDHFTIYGEETVLFAEHPSRAQPRA